MKPRDDSGKFEAKGEQHRQVRSIRLTDATWEKLGQVAESRSLTRADLLELMAEDGYLLAYLDPDQDRLETIATSVLNDPTVTRNGKDRGSVKRAIAAFIDRLKGKGQSV